MGGQKITGNLGNDYRDYLVEYLARGKRGSADLCAYFFLRVEGLLRPGGQCGLVATNTIAQGDTREVGLDQMTANGCVILRAVPSRKWPGTASLEVAHIWLRKGQWNSTFHIDDKPTSGITSFLAEPGTVSGPPHRLASNAGKSFRVDTSWAWASCWSRKRPSGSSIKTPGTRMFCFPTSMEKTSTPALTSRQADGSSISSTGRVEDHFQDLESCQGGAAEGMAPAGIVSEDYEGFIAEDFPDCLTIVEEKVKPERMEQYPQRMS